MTDRPSLALGNITDTAEVQAQVADIVRRFAPGHDMSRVDAAFELVRRGFRGELDGFAPLKTLYHNVVHTNEVVLCAARMLHGLDLAGRTLDADHLDATLIGALFHDSGYLMRHAEAVGTGAQFTPVHVDRGVLFAHEHLAELPPTVLQAVVKVIQITDHRRSPEGWVRFDNPQQELAAYATATADLVGQMANREYLERLLLLYFEFDEAGSGIFSDVHALLEGTAIFYQVTKSRLDNELKGLSVHLRHHFAAVGNQDRNFYAESIARNLAYLDRLVRESRAKRLDMLKRGGIVDQARGLRPIE